MIWDINCCQDLPTYKDVKGWLSTVSVNWCPMPHTGCKGQLSGQLKFSFRPSPPSHPSGNNWSGFCSQSTFPSTLTTSGAGLRMNSTRRQSSWPTRQSSAWRRRWRRTSWRRTSSTSSPTSSPARRSPWRTWQWSASPCSRTASPRPPQPSSSTCTV